VFEIANLSIIIPNLLSFMARYLRIPVYTTADGTIPILLDLPCLCFSSLASIVSLLVCLYFQGACDVMESGNSVCILVHILLRRRTLSCVACMPDVARSLNLLLLHTCTNSFKPRTNVKLNHA
jgi:hypothetical protein